jgi:hypothetical protein
VPQPKESRLKKEGYMSISIQKLNLFSIKIFLYLEYCTAIVKNNKLLQLMSIIKVPGCTPSEKNPRGTHALTPDFPKVWQIAVPIFSGMQLIAQSLQ